MNNRNPAEFINFFTALLIFLSGGIITAILKRAQEKVGFHITDWIAKTIQNLSSGDYYQYLEYLIATNRYLDIRVLSSISSQDLSLKLVYVDLDFKYDGGTDPEATVDFLQVLKHRDNNGYGRKYVIIGRPGGGKTTLIKYLTLTLSENNKRLLKSRAVPRLVPIMLTISEQVADMRTARIMLPELVEKLYRNKGISLPVGWLRRKLQKGDCAVFLDGLDDVANPESRLKVVDWVQDQLSTFPRSHFIVTSRPNGYRSNPLLGVTVIQTCDFSTEKVDDFIDKWYRANAIQRTGTDDQFSRIQAREGAEDLKRRLKLNKDMRRLALNPLLLTMEAIVFDRTKNLPLKRVELYKQMVEVALLQSWRKFITLKDPLDSLQKSQLLQLLAYNMMKIRTPHLTMNEIARIIDRQLLAINKTMTVEVFVKLMRDEYGLLIEAENGEYEFTHKTFQEYLASSYIYHDQSKVADLIDAIGDDWWEETIRLYAAQSDATPLIQRCLEVERQTVPVVRLAFWLLSESHEIAPEIRDELEDRLNRLVEDKDEEIRTIAAAARLTYRIRFMMPLGHSKEIDDTLVTNLEYQLFLDEMKKNSQFFFPDQWKSNRFDAGKALQPVVGVRSSDARSFCDWLEDWDLSPALYKLPSNVDATKQPVTGAEDVSYWIYDGAGDSFELSNPHSKAITRDAVLKILRRDIELLGRVTKAYVKHPTENRTTAQILAGLIDLPSFGGILRRGRAASGAEIRFAADIEETARNKRFTETCEEIARLLGIDFHANVDLLKPHFADKSLTYDPQWLDAPAFSVKALDVGTLSRTMTQLLEQGHTQEGGDANLRIRQLLLRLLQVLRTRKWTALDYRYDATYDFLRWLTRICISFIADQSTSESGAAINFASRRDESSHMRRAVVEMAMLEMRVNGEISSSEGIRIVKEKTEA